MLIMSQNGKLLFLLPSFEFLYDHSSKSIILVKFCSCVETKDMEEIAHR